MSTKNTTTAELETAGDVTLLAETNRDTFICLDSTGVLAIAPAGEIGEKILLTREQTIALFMFFTQRRDVDQLMPHITRADLLAQGNATLDRLVALCDAHLPMPPLPPSQHRIVAPTAPVPFPKHYGIMFSPGVTKYPDGGKLSRAPFFRRIDGVLFVNVGDDWESSEVRRSDPPQVVRRVMRAGQYGIVVVDTDKESFLLTEAEFLRTFPSILAVLNDPRMRQAVAQWKAKSTAEQERAA
jgi:hypothetical protein